MPLALEDRPKGTRAYSLLQGDFSIGDLPVVTRVSVASAVLKQHKAALYSLLSPHQKTTTDQAGGNIPLSSCRPMRRICVPCALRGTSAASVQGSPERRAGWWGVWARALGLRGHITPIRKRRTQIKNETRADVLGRLTYRVVFQCFLKTLDKGTLNVGQFRIHIVLMYSRTIQTKLTSMMTTLVMSTVLTMWTLGVEVERCRCRDWPSPPVVGKLKVGDRRPDLEPFRKTPSFCVSVSLTHQKLLISFHMVWSRAYPAGSGVKARLL